MSGPFTASPAVYAVPRDEEDLERILALSRAEGLPLIPRGAGTGMPGGNLGPGIVVDMATPFTQLQPVEGDRIRAGAGVPAQVVDRMARKAGLHLPPLPSSARWCSVGGMAANNAAGARSFGHGSAASWVVGLEGIDAQGRPFRLESGTPGLPATGRGPAESGLRREVEEALGAPVDPGSRVPGWPHLRKNASGFALDRFLHSGDPIQLLVGSEGTLALITGVTFRLAPLPQVRGVRLLPLDSPETLTLAALAAPDTGAVACEFLGRRFLEVAGLDRHPAVGALSRGAWGLLLLEFEGEGEAVEEGLSAARRLGRHLAGEGRGSTDPGTHRELWAIRHAASPEIAAKAKQGLYSTQFIEDSVVPPRHLGRYLEGVEEILARHRLDAVIFGHAGDGNLHVNPLLDLEAHGWLSGVRSTLEEVVELVAGLGGTLSGEHGDGRLRAPFLDRIWPPPIVAAFRRVKDHFDPGGRLNPGVILPQEGQDPLAGLRPRARAWPG